MRSFILKHKDTWMGQHGCCLRCRQEVRRTAMTVLTSIKIIRRSITIALRSTSSSKPGNTFLERGTVHPAVLRIVSVHVLECFGATKGVRVRDCILQSLQSVSPFLA